MDSVVLLCLLLTVVASQNVTTPTSANSIPTNEAKSANVEFIKRILESPVEDIQWADDQTIFVLSEKGAVYLSVDAGRTWKNQMPKFVKATSNDANAQHVIQGMYISKIDRTKVFLMGKLGDNWFSVDMGKNFQWSPLPLTDIRLHPTQAMWLLGSGMSEGCSDSKKGACFKKLYMSKDFGANWQPLLDYVVQLDWSPPVITDRRISDDWIYVTAHSEKSGNQRFGTWDKNIHFIVSRDYFKSYEVLVQHGNRFLFGDYSFLFVAQVNPLKEEEVVLQISRDNVTHMHFDKAILPVSLKQHSYTILDSSEGTVFLHVNHQPFSESAYAGHIYVSDWSGLYFTLSLPYNHRSSDGKCDFEKVEGLEGIYLGNFIDEEDMDKYEVEQQTKGTRLDKASRRNRLRTKTVITFDKGGEWHYLAAPTTDSKGEKINCEGCTLHLHGVTDRFGPFYTSHSATGLIMGTGLVGSYLQQSTEINTYMSRDAGLTWREVAKGSHIYEFGDHGGLVVMAEDNRPTNFIYYSWDEGLTWTKLKISDDSLLIENIIIEPKSLSQAFVVYGWQEQSGVIIYLDFTELHTRECTGHDKPDTSESDYETWSPSDGRLAGKCLLGHTATYTRRKPEKQCFNPVKHERAENYQHCPCQAADFECDYGYERSTKGNVAGTAVGGECVKMANLPTHEDPAKHIDGHRCVIRQTKGYRRVPGDTCVGGSQWDAVEMDCPSSTWGKAILFFLLVIIIGFLFVFCTSRYSDYSEGCVYRIKEFFPKMKGYSLVGKGGSGPDTAEEDFFDHDEVGPSAHLIGSEPQKRLANENFSSDLESGSAPSKKSKAKKSKNSTKEPAIQFRGLPNAKQSSRDVPLPTILPPPGGSSV
jgi:hypothetical protein